MHKSIITHTDLDILLTALTRAGVALNNGENEGDRFIRKDWRKNEGEIMFRTELKGRKGDELIYNIYYTDDFNECMQGVH